MIMQLQTGSVDFICTDMPTAMGACATYDNLVILDFSGSEDNFKVDAGEINIGISVVKGNTTLLDWINDEIKSLGEESFFHKDYEETLVDTYGLDYEDELVVEGGETNA